MVLELGRIPIKKIDWGRTTRIEGNLLRINRKEFITKAWGKDSRIVCMDADLALPGESVRIIAIKDVIQPRVKVQGTGGIFPGLVSRLEKVGNGRTHVLEGCSVMTVGQIVGFQEGMLDMTGPGARYSSFSKLLNVVLVTEVKKGITRQEHEESLRFAGLRAAAYLGEAGRFATPEKIERIEVNAPFDAKRARPDLPKVAYVYMLLSQGLLHDTYLYGQDLKTLKPTLILPTEVMDGAVVSGNCVSACDKNTTYHHLNNPIIEELCARNGIDLHFAGVIVTNANVTLADKEQSSSDTAKLVEQLAVDGVILSKEGFGNPDADVMMSCAKIEERGIFTVLITDEFAGADGGSQSLADAHPRANALVSVGNANMPLTLPPMDRIIGDVQILERLSGGRPDSLSKDGGIRVELQTILGATNELGFESLSCREI